jgi:membrane protease YdiL (CAAX protease family)
MVQDGSTPARPLPLLLGVTATVTGILAMRTPLLVAPFLVGAVGFRGFIAVSEALLAVPALLAVGLRRAPPSQTLALSSLSRRGLAVSVGLGATLWVASLGLLELQNVVWPADPEYIAGFRRLHDLLYPRGPFDAFLSLATIALMPAVCEEIATRGVLLPSLRSALAPLPAIGISAAVFALMHFDPYRTPFTFAVGLVLGALRLRAGSLWPSLLAHATLNALTFAAAPFLDDPAQPLPDPRPFVGLALLMVGSALTALVWRHLPGRADERPPN